MKGRASLAEIKTFVVAIDRRNWDAMAILWSLPSLYNCRCSSCGVNNLVFQR